MNRTLRLALCGEVDPIEEPQEEQKNKTVLMKGPLAGIFSQALMILYSKKPTESEPGLESQANDAIMAMTAARAAAHVDNHLYDGVGSVAKSIQSAEVEVPFEEDANVYAIDSHSVNPKTILAAAADLPLNRDRRNIMVIDVSGNPKDVNAPYYTEHRSINFDNTKTAENVGLNPALSLECEKYGMTVVVGLEGLIALLGRKQK